MRQPGDIDWKDWPCMIVWASMIAILVCFVFWIEGNVGMTRYQASSAH
jgi:hypothetical protein